MKKIKRILGIVWIILGLVAGYYLVINQALPQFATGKVEDLIPAVIYTAILMPIITGGLLIFGYYALTGEYDDN